MDSGEQDYTWLIVVGGLAQRVKGVASDEDHREDPGQGGQSEHTSRDGVPAAPQAADSDHGRRKPDLAQEGVPDPTGVP